MLDETRAAFAAAAADDGIVLGSETYDWLCEQGHIGLERVAKARRDPAIVAPVIEALGALAAIFARLKGDVSVLVAARENLYLPVDLVHAPSGTLIEVDGAAHFTSARLAALDLYPAGAALGFDIDEHRELCRSLCATSDVLSRGMPGQGVRLRGRAAGARLPRRAARSGDARHGPSAADPDRGRRRRRRGCLPQAPSRAARARRPERVSGCAEGGRR